MSSKQVNKVKAKRIELKLTQEELAEKVGVKTRHIAYIEAGEKSPSLAVAKKIALALGVTLGDLF